MQAFRRWLLDQSAAFRSSSDDEIVQIALRLQPRFERPDRGIGGKAEQQWHRHRVEIEGDQPMRSPGGAAIEQHLAQAVRQRLRDRPEDRGDRRAPQPRQRLREGIAGRPSQSAQRDSDRDDPGRRNAIGALAKGRRAGSSPRRAPRSAGTAGRRYGSGALCGRFGYGGRAAGASDEIVQIALCAQPRFDRPDCAIGGDGEQQAGRDVGEVNVRVQGRSSRRARRQPRFERGLIHRVGERPDDRGDRGAAQPRQCPLQRIGTASTEAAEGHADAEQQRGKGQSVDRLDPRKAQAHPALRGKGVQRLQRGGRRLHAQSLVAVDQRHRPRLPHAAVTAAASRRRARGQPGKDDHRQHHRGADQKHQPRKPTQPRLARRQPISVRHHVLSV
ncbi:hypothetical protein WR25_22566 [Diploscapter pachys]|uniref:Uncharacterized protein n=1 Tax=Diploscapter pachys TaxID=2018661 RepID=A0A2A2K4P9_9BILA|nr:hypothetical protein WR25_22566 [Diploscapter pachys]